MNNLKRLGVVCVSVGAIVFLFPHKESSLHNSKIYGSFQEFFEDTLKPSFDEWARLESEYNYVSEYCPGFFDDDDHDKPIF